MDRPSFTHRFIIPVVKLLLITGGSFAVYTLAISLKPSAVRNVLCYIFGLTFFISLVFGAVYVYIAASRRGARTGEKIIAGLVGPFLWSTKEVLVVSSIYSLGEGIYYYLNPVNFLLFSLVLAEMGVAEVMCRRLEKTRPEGQSSPLPAILAMVLGLGSIAFMFAWELGVHHFYIFQQGYKAFFGFGL